MRDAALADLYRAVKRLCQLEWRVLDTNGAIQIPIEDGQYLEVQLSDLALEEARRISWT